MAGTGKGRSGGRGNGNKGGRPGGVGHGRYRGKGAPRDAKGRKRNLAPDGRKQGLAGKTGAAGVSNSNRKPPKGRVHNDRRAASRTPKGMLIEGRRAAHEALAAGVPLRRAYIAANKGTPDQALVNLGKELEAAGVDVEEVPKSRLDSLSVRGAHQGVLLVAEPFPYVALEDVIDAAGDGDALVILLDHVTDEGNLGAIARTAEVVGAAGVVIPKARAAGVGLGAYKTSAGAVAHLPIAQVPNLAKAVDQLKDAGFWACCSTEHAADTVWGAPMHGRLALVMGSEGDGVSRLVQEKCDFAARLPQRGKIESLNVAQATTVMAYEWLRRTWKEATLATVEDAPAGTEDDWSFDVLEEEFGDE